MMERKLFQEEHHLLRKTLGEFIEQKVLPEYPKWEKEGLVPKKMWLDAGEMGWLCPTAEQEYGGLGAELLHSVVIAEELAYYGTPGFFISLHNDIVFPYLEQFGNPSQLHRWVPGCVSGETILALAMTEPGHGSDLGRIETRAVLKNGEYVINGSKIFISNGQLADLFIVAVRTSSPERPHDGISLLLVPSDSPGFARGRNLEKIGLHAQDTSEIFFDDCRVPAENLLGEENRGFAHMMQNLQQERLFLALGAVAHASGALKHTLDYVKSRKAFGQELSRFQHIRFELAELATKIQVTQSFIDDLIPRHMQGEELTREVSMAKYWASDVEFEVCDRCLQLFGGYGYMSEYPISRYFLDARVQRIYGGTNEIMKELIARQLGI